MFKQCSLGLFRASDARTDSYSLIVIRICRAGKVGIAGIRFNNCLRNRNLRISLLRIGAWTVSKPTPERIRRGLPVSTRLPCRTNRNQRACPKFPLCEKVLRGLIRACISSASIRHNCISVSSTLHDEVDTTVSIRLRIRNFRQRGKPVSAIAGSMSIGTWMILAFTLNVFSSPSVPRGYRWRLRWQAMLDIFHYCCKTAT